MNILIGTRNAYKAEEMEHMLNGLPNVNIYFLKDTSIDLDIEEDGKTLKENAEKKAIEISKYTDMYVFTSDNGVNIPGLGDKWNMQTPQRNVGHDNTDVVKAKKLLNMMKGLKGEDRLAMNNLALALGYKGSLLWSDEDITDRGYITEELIDENIPEYKWVGHLWYYPKFNKVFNKLTSEEVIEVRKQDESIKRRLREYIQNI